MAEAEEQVNAAEGALLPQVSLGATAGYQKYGRSLFGPLNFSVPPFAYYTVGPTRQLSAGPVRRREAQGRTAAGAAGISGLRAGRRLSVAHRPCRRRSAGAGFGAGADRDLERHHRRRRAQCRAGAIGNHRRVRHPRAAGQRAKPAGGRPRPDAGPAPAGSGGAPCAVRSWPAKRRRNGARRNSRWPISPCRPNCRSACPRNWCIAAPISAPRKPSCMPPAPPSASPPPTSIRTSTSPRR